MKKILSVILAVILVFSTLAGCSAKKKTTIKLGLAAPTSTHGWVAGVAYYAEKYCSENNIEYMLTTSDNATEMEANLDSLVEWGAQAIVVWPQWSGMEDKISNIITSGIPVVGFDVDINCNGVYKVTGNNYDMGYQCAKYIVSKVGEAATIAVMDVPSVGSVSQLRKQGFYDYLDEISYDTSNIFEVSETAFSRDIGYSDMQDVLNEHSKIDAVFSMDDETSIGVVKAVAEAKRTDIKAITGGGGMQEYFEYILSSDYSKLGLASALYSPSMIEDAIDSAINIAEGNSSSKVIVIPTTIVTADNAKDYIDSDNIVY